MSTFSQTYLVCGKQSFKAFGPDPPRFLATTIREKIPKNLFSVFVTSCAAAKDQCDQTARLFFNLWPFATMKIYPVAKYIDKVATNAN